MLNFIPHVSIFSSDLLRFIPLLIYLIFLATSDSRSRSPKQLESTNDDDDQSDSPLQFQLSINEEADDGIEADLSNEDDDQTTSISTIEVHSLYKDLHEALII